MSRDLERTLRDVPRSFPRPAHETTAETLRNLRATFARSPRRRNRRRLRWAIVVVAVAAATSGAVAFGVDVMRPKVEGLPNPVHREGTFRCPRFAPAFRVEIGASKYGLYGQATTPGAPIARGGSIVYGQIGEKTAAADRVCQRVARASAGRAASFAGSDYLTPTQGTYVESETFTCAVRGRVLVRFDFLERAGQRIGTRLDIGVEGRRNLLARIVVRESRVTIQTARACS